MSINTSELVVKALGKTLNIENLDKINSTDKLKEDLGMDSMSSLTFLMTLEEMINGFYVDPDTLDMDYLNNVSSITEYVNKQLELSNNG